MEDVVCINTGLKPEYPKNPNTNPNNNPIPNPNHNYMALRYVNYKRMLLVGLRHYLLYQWGLTNFTVAPNYNRNPIGNRNSNHIIHTNLPNKRITLQLTP